MAMYGGKGPSLVASRLDIKILLDPNKAGCPPLLCHPLRREQKKPSKTLPISWTKKTSAEKAFLQI